MFYINRSSMKIFGESVENVFEAVEEFYKLHKVSFTEFEFFLEQDFKIPKDITGDAVKSYLGSAFNFGENYRTLQSQSLATHFIYILAILYFLLLSIFGRRNFKEQKVDVLFENCFSSGIQDDYIGLYNNLGHHNLGVMQTSRIRGYSLFKFWKSEDINIGGLSRNVFRTYAKYSGYYNSAISQRILFSLCKRYKSYVKLSNLMGLNFLQLALRISKSIAVYETDIGPLKAKVLISFDDNAYRSLRYYIYKQKINSIMVIQNGCRMGFESNRLGDMYLYSDYYFGFGKKSIQIQSGMKSTNKLGVGSLRLFNVISNNNYSSNSSYEYDVIFLEQLSESEVPAYSFITYRKCIELICKFAIDNPQYTVAYRTRISRRNLSFMGEKINTNALLIDGMLKGAGIYISDDMTKDSYLEVLRSKVVIFYTSTLGFEAIGMNKRVLNLNLDKLSLGISNKNEIDALVDYDHNLFQEKLHYLLKSSDSKLSELLRCRKMQFMNAEENIENVICSSVAKEVLRDYL